MKFKGGEFSTGTMGNFQPELTRASFLRYLTPARSTHSMVTFDNPEVQTEKIP